MWVKVDTGFFSHPKARAVGRDGRELFLASCCWAAETEKDGLVYSRDLPVLAALAEVKPSVSKRLVEVGFWEVHPQGWLVHDYLDYNPSAATDREMRRKRAEAGRRGGRNSKASGSKPEANASANGEANPEAEPKQTANPYSYSSSENPPSHPQTTSSGDKSGAEGEDVGKQTKPDRQSRALAACDILGDQAHQARVDAGTVTNPVGHRRSCRASAHRDHLEQAQRLAHANPRLTPDEIADEINAPPDEPAPRPANPMLTDWNQVLNLATQGQHVWRDNPELSPTARAAASEVAWTIRNGTADSARVAFYDAWKRLAGEGVR